MPAQQASARAANHDLRLGRQALNTGFEDHHLLAVDKTIRCSGVELDLRKRQRDFVERDPRFALYDHVRAFGGLKGFLELVGEFIESHVFGVVVVMNLAPEGLPFPALLCNLWA